MNIILGAIAILTTLVTGGAILYRIAQGRVAMISFRTLFLFGFFFFYGLATAFLCFVESSAWIYTPNGAGYVPLAICIPLFVVIFLLCGRWGYRSVGLTRLIPSVQIRPCTASIITAIVVCEVMAVLGLSPLGDYFSALIGQSKAGFAACAAGLATYWLIAKRYNPVAWTVFGFTFVLSCLVSMSGGTDRRFVLGVFLVVVWVWYFVSLQYRTTRSTFTKFGVAGLAVTAFVIFYSSFRNVSEDTTLQRRVEQFSGAAKDPLNIRKSTVDSVFMQDAPINTLYIMETYPEFQPLQPLHGLYYFVVNPIPRSIFPEKPLGLGYELQQQFNIGANLGPGIIGHGWSEATWLGVIYYAAFFGFMCGLVDRKTESQANNPFYLSIVGSSLGNVLGLSRGETALFLALIVTGWITTYLVLAVMNLVGKSTFAAWPRLSVEGDHYMQQQALDAARSSDFYSYDSASDTYDAVAAAHYDEETPPDEHRHTA